MAQQATLETRDAKHEPRTLAEQRAAWYAQAAATLGGPDAVRAMINKTLNPIPMTSPRVDAQWLTATAENVLEAVEERRSTWQSWHVRAEAQRQVRAVQVPTNKVDQLVELLVTEVLHTQSISLTRRDDGITEPGVLRRADGFSVYTVAGSDLFTSTRILAAEQRLVASAGRTDGPVQDAGTVELALLESAANGNILDAGQAALVRAMCTSGARLQLAIAPAGAGKPPPCAPWLGRGATAAATWSGWPRPAPRRRNSATPPVHRSTRWPSSRGPSATVSCRIGRNASTGPAW